MEEMKNLVIQALETKGVLGQIRANLRSSVFKIVDEQDQKYNMGCGLKWENNKLYQITDTKTGNLLAELIREFMEFFKMDYSLSVFIPECSISPERLKREEIFAKLGIKTSLPEDHIFSGLPFIYLVLTYFLENVGKDQAKLNTFLKNYNYREIEKITDDMIDKNIRLFYAYNQMSEDAVEDTQDKNKQFKKNIEFEKIDDDDINVKRSYEYQDRRNLYINSELDNIKNIANEDRTHIDSIRKNDNIKHQISNEDVIDIEEIDEEIICQEDSFEKSAEKKESGNHNISQSGGFDGTVDSNALERYNYIEQVDKS